MIAILSKQINNINNLLAEEVSLKENLLDQVTALIEERDQQKLAFDALKNQYDELLAKRAETPIVIAEPKLLEVTDKRTVMYKSLFNVIKRDNVDGISYNGAVITPSDEYRAFKVVRDGITIEYSDVVDGSNLTKSVCVTFSSGEQLELNTGINGETLYYLDEDNKFTCSLKNGKIDVEMDAESLLNFRQSNTELNMEIGDFLLRAYNFGAFARPFSIKLDNFKNGDRILKKLDGWIDIYLSDVMYINCRGEFCSSIRERTAQ